MEEQGLAKKINVTKRVNMSEGSLPRIEEEEFVLEDQTIYGYPFPGTGSDWNGQVRLGS